MTDSEPNQGSMEGTQARFRDPALTGPVVEPSGDAVPRPRSSGTDVNTGAGRAPDYLQQAYDTLAAAYTRGEISVNVVRSVFGAVTLTLAEADDAADALAYCADLNAFTGTPEEARYRRLAARLSTAYPDGDTPS